MFERYLQLSVCVKLVITEHIIAAALVRGHLNFERYLQNIFQSIHVYKL